MTDILIKNGIIFDGTGQPSFTGDIAVTRDRITDIGNLGNIPASLTIDASGLAVCPGFIDIHSHADFSIFQNDHDSVLRPLVLQGITTVVGGNCGYSSCFMPESNRELAVAYLDNLSGQSQNELINWNTPAQFMERLDREGILVNTATLVGHGSLRISSSGLVKRLLFPDEQKVMESYLEECMEMGCMGMSSGLQYFPGLQSDTEELSGLGSVLKKYAGIFTSHLRSYSHTLDLAIDEVCDVGERCGIRVQISHLYWQPYVRRMAGITRGLVRAGSFMYNRLKIPVPVERGLMPKISHIDRRRENGVDVSFDMVPSCQGFTELLAFLPPCVSEGSREMALERLRDKEYRKRVLHDIKNTEPVWPHRDGATWSFNYIKMTGWQGLRVMAVEKDNNRWMEGLTFPEIGYKLGAGPFDVLCDLLIDESGRVMVFHTPVQPDDPFVFRSMWAGFTHPRSVPATDTILRPFGRPSHVFYDCFPRFIDYFVKQKGLLTFEEAVRKCTGLPAEIMGIRNRGLLNKGCYADISILDPETLGTAADFHNPAIHPTGIMHVLINGVPVVSDGRMNSARRAGSVIRRGDS